MNTNGEKAKCGENTLAHFKKFVARRVRCEYGCSCKRI